MRDDSSDNEMNSLSKNENDKQEIDRDENENEIDSDHDDPRKVRIINDPFSFLLLSTHFHFNSFSF